MSLINEFLQKLKPIDVENCNISTEETEINLLFPEMHTGDKIELVNAYRVWKLDIESDKELTFIDFIKDINGDVIQKRKPLVTVDVKEKLLLTLGSKVMIAKPNQQKDEKLG